jgi:hypothetical protein
MENRNFTDYLENTTTRYPSRSRRGPSIIVIALLIFLSACNVVSTPTPTVPPSTATPTPLVPPTAPAGWSVHKNASFQISLPGSWQEIPLDEARLKSEVDAASANNPHLADLLRGILEGGQFKSLLFYATDRTSTNVISNVSLTRTTLPNSTSVDQAARDYAQALPQILKGAKLVAIDTPLDINGQQGAEVDYDLPLVNVAGQVVTLRGVQYLVVLNAGNAYVVTVTGEAAKEESFVPLARQIGRSFALVAP